MAGRRSPAHRRGDHGRNAMPHSDAASIAITAVRTLESRDGFATD